MYRALVVDDVDAIRYSIAGQVDESATPVVTAGTAENGEKALEWLDTHYSDICITDIRMPVVDGLELIARIRKKYPWMASLVISSYDDFSYARAGIQLEAVDYILKPIDEDSLEKALCKAVEIIEKSRHSGAASLMLSHVSEYGMLLEKWVEQIKLAAADSGAVIDETVKILCGMAEGRHFLLSFLAEEWISRVTHELKLSKPAAGLQKAAGRSLSPKTLKNTEAGYSFALDCTKILKEAMEAIRGSFVESKSSQLSRMLDKTMGYIRENYTRSDLTVQEIADYVLFSKNHIANVFKQEMGMTLWNYIIDLRMQKAKKLLAESTVKTLEIAMNVGYSNYNHFSRLFKEYWGISAQEYRKKAQG